MKTIKRWYWKDSKTLTDADSSWLKNQYTLLIQDAEYEDAIDGFGGRSSRYCIRPARLLIETDCPKKESMLLLKYGEQLALLWMATGMD